MDNLDINKGNRNEFKSRPQTHSARQLEGLKVSKVYSYKTEVRRKTLYLVKATSLLPREIKPLSLQSLQALLNECLAHKATASPNKPVPRGTERLAPSSARCFQQEATHPVMTSGRDGPYGPVLPRGQPRSPLGTGKLATVG